MSNSACKPSAFREADLSRRNSYASSLYWIYGELWHIAELLDGIVDGHCSYAPCRHARSRGPFWWERTVSDMEIGVSAWWTVRYFVLLNGLTTSRDHSRIHLQWVHSLKPRFWYLRLVELKIYETMCPSFWYAMNCWNRRDSFDAVTYGWAVEELEERDRSREAMIYPKQEVEQNFTANDCC